MSGNKSLSTAKKNKEDEFYTQLCDIENELGKYTELNVFKNKTVICNCDDPFESNFTLYFLMHFNSLKLKRLISTGYSTSSIMGRDLPLYTCGGGYEAYCLDIKSTKEYLSGEQTDLDSSSAKKMLEENRDVLTYKLKGDGDFRSEESIALLDQADIVVGNPPFSLFRKYLDLIIEHNKLFLIIGNQNNITYKETFKWILQGKVWLGYNAGDMAFKVPDSYEARETRFWIDETGQKWRSFGNICWFTNIDTPKHHELFRTGYVYKGHEDMYPKYDGYDAIDLGKYRKDGKRTGDSSVLPYDYEGVMGVPVSWLDKHCPEQFEIIGLDRYTVPKEYLVGGRVAINGNSLYARILIKAKQPGRNDWDAWQKEIDEKQKGEK